MFSGFLLFAIGVTIFILNIFYNLRDFVLIIGLFLALAGFYLILTGGNLINVRNGNFVLNSESDSPLNKIKSRGNSENINLTLSQKNSGSTDDFISDNSYDSSSDLNQTLSDVEDINSKSVLIKSNKQTSNFTDKPYQFTPNYERPVKVTRRPVKKNLSIDLSKIPEAEKSHEIDEDLVKYNDESSNQRFSDKSDYEDSNGYIIVDHSSDTASDEDYGIYDDNDYEDEYAYGTPFKLSNEPDSRENDIDSSINSIDNEIKIDPNNPESLPIPKSLKSFVVTSKGRLTTQEAAEELSYQAINEILLITNSLTDLSHKFLDNISHVHTRLIIEDSDFDDLSTALVVNSLIDKDIEIRTMPVLDTINLLVDDNYALIVSDDETNKDFQYGAVYSNKNSVIEIKNMFEKTWDLAEPVNKDKLLVNN